MHFVIHVLLLFLEGKSKIMVVVYEEAKEEPPSWRPGQRISTLWKRL